MLERGAAQRVRFRKYARQIDATLTVSIAVNQNVATVRFRPKSNRVERSGGSRQHWCRNLLYSATREALAACRQRFRSQSLGTHFVKRSPQSRLLTAAPQANHHGNTGNE